MIKILKNLLQNTKLLKDNILIHGGGGYIASQFLPYAIIVLLLLQAFIFCDKKEGYYIDELWSYGLANSTETPFLHEKQGYMEQWHNSSFYKEYLTVSPDETFSFGTVYSNQEQDVHPPVFYLILHTICSFFPDSFSKWYGLAINLFFFAGTLIILLQISKLILKNAGIIRFIPPIIYGVSAGVLSCVIYIRMYMVLTFFSVAFAALLYYAMVSEGKRENLALAGIGIVSMFGMLTQYYYLIFAFFMSGCYILFRIFRKEWKKAFKYAISIGTGLGLGTLIFPALLTHIFFGDKGRSSMANATGGIYYLRQRLLTYMRLMADAFFWGKTALLNVTLLISLVCLIFAVVYLIKKRQKPNAAAIYLSFIGFSTAAYFVVVAKISTDEVNRYQFLIFPFIALLLAAFFYAVSVMASKIFHIRADILVFAMVCCYVMAWFVSYGAGRHMPEYLYSGYNNALHLIHEKYSDIPGIYITKGDHLVINNCLFLSEQSDTYPMTYEKLPELPKILSAYRQSSHSGEENLSFLLYVDIYYPEEETAEEVRRLTGCQSVELLYDNTYTQIYLLN